MLLAVKVLFRLEFDHEQNKFIVRNYSFQPQTSSSNVYHFSNIYFLLYIIRLL